MTDKPYSEGWICPICGKVIARATTNKGSAKGLLKMHIKWRHEAALSSWYFEPIAWVSDE